MKPRGTPRHLTIIRTDTGRIARWDRDPTSDTPITASDAARLRQRQRMLGRPVVDLDHRTERTTHAPTDPTAA